MSGWREGRVSSLDAEWDGALECTVDVLDDATRTWTPVRALAYPLLVGRPEVGDLVRLNTAALEAGLGTGGYAFVVAIPHRAAGQVSLGPGHLVKARYTPQQYMVLGVDEEASPHHELLRDADDVGGMPVVVAPEDRDHLVATPLYSGGLFLLLLAAYSLAGPAARWPLLAGGMLGYLAYEAAHWRAHHAPRARLGRALRRHHMHHHFVDRAGNFGISTRLWDLVFRTCLKRPVREDSPD